MDSGKKVSADGHTYTIHAMRKWQNWLLSDLLVRQKQTDERLEVNIGLMKYYEKLHAKAITVALLRNPVVYKIFGWIVWRLMMLRHTEEGFSKILGTVVEQMGVSFFFFLRG